MGTAAQEVLGLPELLENILQHLDTKQLFVIQRVNTTFNGNVSGSKKLRRIMFLEPISVTTSTDDATTNNEAAGQERDGMLNPLLAKHTVLSVSSYQLFTFKKEPRRGPTFQWTNGQFSQIHERGYGVICAAEAIDENKAGGLAASWRSMVLTKDGLTTDFHVTLKAGHAVDGVTFTVAGTTELGRVADVIGEVYRRSQLRKVQPLSMGIFSCNQYKVLGVEVSSRYDLG